MSDTKSLFLVLCERVTIRLCLLLPRTSHPVVKFSCTDCEPMVIDKLPFDKYELEHTHDSVYPGKKISSDMLAGKLKDYSDLKFIYLIYIEV